MIPINDEMIESLKQRIQSDTNHQFDGLAFNFTEVISKNGIKFISLLRNSENIDISYVIVPLSVGRVFDKLSELENIARDIGNDRRTNFYSFGTCEFEGNDASFLVLENKFDTL